MSQKEFIYEKDHEYRCPRCRRLLFKALNSFFLKEHPKSCSRCNKDYDCHNCNHKNCYLLTVGGPSDLIQKCPECELDIECIQCERFYYRAWMMEKNRIIEIKCPKCKKIVPLKCV